MDELPDDVFYEPTEKRLSKLTKVEKKEIKDEKYQKIKPIKKQKTIQRRKDNIQLQLDKLETEEEKIQFKKAKKQRRDRLKKNGIDALNSNYKVVIDCGFKELMQARETASLAKQIQEFYSFNRQMEYPVHIYVTSVYPELNLDTYQDVTRINEEFYNTDIFGENCNFVYLTPDADEALEEVRNDEIYIVGGLVDKVIAKNASLNRARELNIKARKLPIDQYIKPEYKKALNVCTAALLIPAYLQYKDWKIAFDKIVPRKFFTLSKQKQLQLMQKMQQMQTIQQPQSMEQVEQQQSIK